MAYAQIPTDVQFTVNRGEFPPHSLIISTDIGPCAVVTTWIFACISILAVIIRIAIRRTALAWTWSDNVFIFLALASQLHCAEAGWQLIACLKLVALGQSITLHLAVHNGLGRHGQSLSEAHLRAYGQVRFIRIAEPHPTSYSSVKSVYSSQILSIVVYCLCKLSLTAVFGLITPSQRFQILFHVVDVFIALWGIAAVFALAFQCRPPRPWAMFGEACINEGALICTNGIINIVTDALLIVLPALIVWNVRIKTKRRLVVMAMFWTRIPVCITAAIQLSTIGPYVTGVDQTWNNLFPSLWNQVTIHLSVICAYIPFSKAFFDRL